jgi:protein ImuB
MTVTKARALAPGLEIADAAPDDDLEGLRRLAIWAQRRYSPLVAPDPPDGILIDITGCTDRFGGEEALASDISRRIMASGLSCHVSVADTAGCAHAVARHVPSVRPVVVDRGQTGDALSILPVAALRLEPGVAEELRRMGFDRIEQLIAAPRAPLAKRFGQQLYRRLDQALGFVPEPIEPIVAPTTPAVWRGLLEPIGTPEAFARVIDDLAADISRRLTLEATGARRLDLLFERVDGQAQAIRIGTAAPSRDPKHLAKLLMARIDTIEPGLGVEAMMLSVPLTEPLAPAQADALAARGKRAPDLPILIDALANRLGQRRLYRAAPHASSMPERAVTKVAPLARSGEARWEDDLPRPSRLIIPPELIDVTAMLPDHPPAMFVWRGERHRVVQADGPERIFGEWWREHGHEAEVPYTVRDYFQVETGTGKRYWLFRLGDGERPSTGPMTWFIHGAFA